MQKIIFKDKIFWLLLIIASIYILGNIGTGSLSTWDEALYAIVAEETFESGDWLLLHHMGEPWFDKPPLCIWSTAVFYKIFGVNEFATRLTSGIFGISTVLLLYIFVGRVYNRNAGLFSALTLLALPHFLHFSKLGMMDVPITFFTLLMIYLFWLGREKPRYLLFTGVVLGIAYLAKGFAAFLGPIIIVLYAVSSGQWRLLFKKQFIIGMLIGVFIAMLWHFNLYLQCGPESVSNYFGFHIFKRATQAIQDHTGGINFYQKAIFNKNKPWSVLMFLSLLNTIWLIIRQRSRAAILLICWIAATYVLYSMVQTKLHWYIMPIYPALAVSSGIFLERFCKRTAMQISLAVILIGMLIQVHVSWAFNLDYTSHMKKMSLYSKQLDSKEKIYISHADYSSIFYCFDFATHIDKEVYSTILANNIIDAYLIAENKDLIELSERYKFNYKPVYKSGHMGFYKIRFKNADNKLL